MPNLLKELQKRVFALEERVTQLEAAQSKTPPVDTHAQMGSEAAHLAFANVAAHHPLWQPPEKPQTASHGPRGRHEPQGRRGPQSDQQLRQRPRTKDQTEAKLATRWLNRVGIVALVVGVAALLIHAFPALPTVGKLLLGLAVAAALVIVGAFLRPRYRVFGQVLISGGLALTYFDAYASHFVASLRIFESAYPALLLMALMVVAIFMLAQKMKSESVAGMALFLGYATALLSQTTLLTLLSLVLLAAASIALLFRNRWIVVPLSSLVFVYATHALWSSGLLSTPPPAEQSFLISFGSLVLYFLVFLPVPFLSAAIAEDRLETSAPEDVPISTSAESQLAESAQRQSKAAKIPALESVIVLLCGLNVAFFATLGFAEIARHQLNVHGPFAMVLTVLFAALAALAASRHLSQALIELFIVAALTTASLALALYVPSGWLGLALALLGAAVLLTISRPPRIAPLALALVLLGAGLQMLLAFRSPLAALLTAAMLLPLERILPKLRGHRDSIVHAARYTLVTLCGVLYLEACSLLLSGVWITAAWVALAVLLLVVGFSASSRIYRISGLVVLAATLCKVVIIDMAQLSVLLRISSVVAMGLVLLGVSFFYARFERGAGRASE
jgi:uncharacterized membrane protein